MTSKIGGWLLYFAVVAAIIFVGWSQPLHYRFLTPQEIANLEHPSQFQPRAVGQPGDPATPAAESGAAGSKPWHTSLDKGAY